MLTKIPKKLQMLKRNHQLRFYKIQCSELMFNWIKNNLVRPSRCVITRSFQKPSFLFITSLLNSDRDYVLEIGISGSPTSQRTLMGNPYERVQQPETVPFLFSDIDRDYLSIRLIQACHIIIHKYYGVPQPWRIQFQKNGKIKCSECLKSEKVWISDSSVVSHSQTAPISDTVWNPNAIKFHIYFH